MASMSNGLPGEATQETAEEEEEKEKQANTESRDLHTELASETKGADEEKILKYGKNDDVGDQTTVVKHKDEKMVEISSVIDGLSMRTPDSEIQQYTYAVVDYDGIPIELDWTRIQPPESDVHGIFLHRLNADEEFILPADTSSVVGILLINSVDQYMLSRTSLDMCRHYSKPIFLITLSDGNTISSLVSSALVDINVDLQCKGADTIVVHHAQEPVIVVNGLEVKEEYFSYTWLPVSQEKKCISCISLADGDKQFPHARLYYVDPQKDVSMTVVEAETMSDNLSMKLLIIINSDNDYKFQGLPNRKWKTPVILVTAKTGHSLKKIVCTGNVEEQVMSLFLIGKDPVHQSLELAVKDHNIEPGKPVINGLQINPAYSSPQYFNYAWLPVTKEIREFTNIAIALQDLSIAHILVCKLTDDEDISWHTARVHDKPNIKMLIAINHGDQLVLHDLPQQKWVLPIAVVTESSGNKILSILRHHTEETLATVHLRQPEDITGQEVVSAQESPLRNVMSKLLPTKDVVVVVSSNIELWKEIMQLFTVHEQASIDSKQFLKDLKETITHNFTHYAASIDSKQFLKDLKETITHNFNEDFLFYFAVIHRICHSVWRNTYDKDAATSILNQCIQAYGKLPITSISKKLLSFKERGDFTFRARLYRKSQESEISTFTYLQNCFQKILQQEDCRPDLSSTLFFIISYYFFNVASGKKKIDMWSKFTERDFKITEGTLTTLSQGQELIEEVKLPVKYRITAQEIGDFLLQKPRPFQHLRDVIHIFKESFVDEEEFYEKLMKSVRKVYTERIWKDLRSEQPHKRKNVIAACVAFLSEIDDIIQSKKWNDHKWEKECQKWWTLLISLVDIPNQREPDGLLEPLLLGHYNVCQRRKSAIIHCVYNHFERVVAKVSLPKFTTLYMKYEDFDDRFWKHYLSQSSKHSSAYCTNIRGWSQLIMAIGKRHPDAEEQAELLHFIIKLWKLRENSCQDGALVFLFDLLTITMPCKSTRSNSTVNTFVARIHTCIRSTSIKERILGSMNHMMKLVTHEDGFQQVVLTAIKKGITIKLKDLKEMNPPTKVAIDVCCQILMQDWNWIVGKPSPNQTLSLEIIVQCATEIPLNLKSLASINECLQLLTTVYYNCDSKYQLSLEGGGLHHDISSNPSINVRFYFEWVLSLLENLKQWKESISTHFDRVQDYERYHEEISALARSIKADDCVVSKMETSKKRSTYISDFLELNEALVLIDTTERKANWCSSIDVLSKWGISFPTNLRNEIHESIAFPNELDGKQLNLITPSVTPAGYAWQIHLKCCLSFQGLRTVLSRVKCFLSPISSNMKLLAYFHLHTNMIFSLQLKQALNQHQTMLSPSQLQTAVESVKAIMKTIFEGICEYRHITMNGELDILNKDVVGEVQRLGYCPFFDVKVDVITAISNLLLLLRCLNEVKVLKEVFVQLELQKCQDDAGFKSLIEEATKLCSEDKRQMLTTNSATYILQRVVCIMCPEFLVGESLQKYHGTVSSTLDIFQSVSESAEFFQFLKEYKFIGREGYLHFKTQFALVRDILQAEDYNENVLNHLFVAFEYLSPFLEPFQSFSCLMTSVSELKPENGIVYLKTVRENIHMVRLWFSRSEGDTIENVSNELEDIMENGNYFIGTCRKLFVLTYHSRVVFKKSHLPSRQPRHNDDPRIDTEMQLHKTAIDNFVQKLGFLDSTDDEDLVKKFRHITNCAYEIFEYVNTLKDLGHPEYCKDNFQILFSCNQPEPSATEKVETHKKVLRDWERQQHDLYEKHKWLMFYTIPKLMKLFRYLIMSSVRGILKETLFLFKHDLLSAAVLEKAIQKTLPAACLENTASPMKLVGPFLDQLFSETTVQTLLLPQRYPPFKWCQKDASTLHICSEFTQSQIILQLFSIYQGLPEAFEILHCTSLTSESGIRLFMKRVLSSPSTRKYVVLDVDTLPFHLQELLMSLYMDMKQQPASSLSEFHLIETSPSVFDEMSPFLKTVKYIAEEGPRGTVEDVTQLLSQFSICTTYLVYGPPGIGKTHYIMEEKLQCVPPEHRQIISVNEAFSTSFAINKLCSLPFEEDECVIFLNFTILHSLGKVDEKEYTGFNQLMTEVGWFLFKLLILGYVEDNQTGQSFQVPSNSKWSLYVEVPSCDQQCSMLDNLKLFLDKVPILQFFGKNIEINAGYKYKIDEDVQLVCKYLRAYKEKQIDRLYKEGKDEVRFSGDKDLCSGACEELLVEFMPKHTKANKITQRTFIQYMARRCKFLEHFPAFNFNMGVGRGQCVTKHLGSTLMDTMLKEVSDFCDPSTKEEKIQKTHHQIIYDFKDRAGTIGLISLNPEKIEGTEKAKFRKIGFELPTMSEMYSKAKLELYLSRSLNVPLERGKTGEMVLTQIEMANYVLTPDFTLKMLNIHERYMCGVPVIIEGETGVGKTALVKMLSDLWNDAWKAEWILRRSRILDLLEKYSYLITQPVSPERREFAHIISVLKSGQCPSQKTLEEVCSLSHGGQPFYEGLPTHSSISSLQNDPVFFMLDCDHTCVMEHRPNSKSTAKLLHTLLTAQMRQTFYKLNIHEALTPDDIEEFFEPVFQQAISFQEAFKKVKSTSSPVPFVIVYLDEINTSSCLGLFKEIIVDRMLLGKIIPENIFMIASCNPHRGDVLSLLDRKEPAPMENHDHTWLKGTYYVRKLHPTLHYLMWSYGSLSEHEERVYVNVKMQMLNEKMDPYTVSALSDLIVESQNKMREYACNELRRRGLTRNDSLICAKSCVSQRDIQRVFVFYKWFHKVYELLQVDQINRRAILISLGIVYFMRLTSQYRIDYRGFLDSHERLMSELTFSKAYKEELERWVGPKFVRLPPGISKATPLKENLLAIIACTQNHIPLVIVGAPGSSKTISFNIAVANLKGKESKEETFRNSEIFQSLEPHFYQCSRRTTSTEIDKIFDRALSRQRNLFKSNLPAYCVVFMDEVGLPEDKYESLKALHYHLDAQDVSFVAISNHLLDAAKTNRAVSLIRPKSTALDLNELASDCILRDGARQSSETKELVSKLGAAYLELIETSEFSRLYGLRDFIYFIMFLRRKGGHSILPQVIVHGLERCFNGTNQFHKLCKHFVEKLYLEDTTKQMLRFRNVLSILKDSLSDKAFSERDEINSSIQSEVRYKLIIDPSADESVVRLLFAFGILKRQETKVYVSSDFLPDHHSKVNMISQIRHSVAVGHTVLLSQTDDIHESFYDLFNQRFRSIQIPGESLCRYYANIAIGAHSKPCRVNPSFQCIVIVKEEDLSETPAPFLNRFEKYYLSHENLLMSLLEYLPPCLQDLLNAVRTKVREFINVVAYVRDMTHCYTLFGLTASTLDSLILGILPVGNEMEACIYTPLVTDPYKEVSDVKQHILLTLIGALRDNAKFNIEEPSRDEIVDDAESIFKMVLSDNILREELEKIENGDDLAVRNAVDGGLHVLFNASGSKDDNQSDIFLDYCLVITILAQWLVSYICKRLMQLMTPEALVKYNQLIPHSYLRHYLKFQQHFCIGELVECQLNKLQSNKWRISHCANKIICFTRTSPLIQQFCSDSTHQDWMEKYIYKDMDKLKILKISSAHTQTFVQTSLKHFVESAATVLLVIVRMPEMSLRMVNHLRIMIEEAENTGIENKLFILLIHFPSTIFFDPCYPSLFLQGWDHYYLDSIGHGTLNVEGKVIELLAVKQWFEASCFHTGVPISTQSQMYDTLKSVVQEAISIVSPKILVPSKHFGCFNTPMNPTDRIQSIKCILIDHHIGFELAKVFCAYWTPQVMNNLIVKLTNFTDSKKSTLNLTDSIQTSFRSLFLDFVVFGLNQFNDDYSLDVLYQAIQDGDEIMINLCCSLLVLSKPDLSQLTVLCSRYSQPLHTPMNNANFPLFGILCTRMDEVITACKKHQGSMVHYSISAGGSSDMKDLCTSVLQSIKESKDCLCVALEAIEADKSGKLWNCYCKEILFHKLNITKPTSLTVRFLDAYVRGIDRGSVASLMVYLHIHIEEHKLKLPQLVKILRPISKFPDVHIEATLKSTDYQPALEQLSSLSTLIIEPLSPREPALQPDIYTFIIHLLLESLRSQSEDSLNHELNQMEVLGWCRCFQDIIIMPGLLEGLIRNCACQVQQQMNVMNSTYIAIQYGGPVFGIRHFRDLTSKQDPQVINPRLQECIESAEKMLIASSGFKFKSYIEAQLAFFFSNYRMSFAMDDWNWFLHVCNRTDISKHICSHNVLLLHLSRVLLLGNEMDAMLGLFNAKMRREVGSVLLINTVECRSRLCNYLPPYYRTAGYCHKYSSLEGSNLMEQCLADLYFEAVLEQLHKKGSGIAGKPLSAGYIIRQIKNIEKNQLDEAEKVLWTIERQALLQILLQQVAMHFSNSVTKGTLFVTSTIEGINQHLMDANYGGGGDNPSWHGLVIAFHLIKQTRSTQKVINMLQDTHGTLATSVHGTRQLRKIIETMPPSDHHLLPFIGRERERSDLGKLYISLCSILVKLHNNRGKKVNLMTHLTVLARRWCSNHIDAKLSDGRRISGKRAFMMTIWLCVYFKFFREKNYSSYLVKVVEDLQTDGILDPQFCYLLQSFLNPQNMICSLEPPMLMDSNAARFKLVGSKLVPVSLQGERRDPIFELFNPPHKTDCSDQELCDALANMIAAIVVWEPRKMHLWYHLFAARELKQTYMTGFLFNDTVKEGRSYDCGVEFTADGTYGRPDYHIRANSGSFSLHSLYLLLWSNFGAFCISMLTQPDGEQQITENKIIADINPIRHYCVSQLRSFWLHMQLNMRLSKEELGFFMRQCMHSLIELSTTPEHISDGCFLSLQEVEAYERNWHERVFMANINDIRSKFQNYNQEKQPTLLNDIRHLASMYPYFPTMEEFHHTMLLHHDFGNSPEDPLYIISQLTLNMPRLEAAGNLLPDLIQFYNWLHTEGVYKVEREYALKNGMEDFITKMNKKYPAIEVPTLYEKIRVHYNRYVEVVGKSIGVGACANTRRKNTLYEITDETKIISLLSTGTIEDGYDWLYLVIKDIIDFHNNLLDRFQEALQHGAKAAETQIPALPDYTCISPLEVDGRACIIPPSSDPFNSRQLCLIRSRLVSCDHNTPKYDFESLQNDMVLTFILGKNKINDECLRKEFIFYEKRSEITLDLSVLDLSGIDIEHEFKIELSYPQQKEMECTFHSSDYHTMMSIVTELRTAIDHLVKVLIQTKSEEERVKLQESSMSEFLEAKGIRPRDSQGFGHGQISDSQMKWMTSQRVPNMFFMLKFFVQWIKDGMYDFHHLPFLMKVDLSDTQCAAIHYISENPVFKADPNYPEILLMQIESFQNVLLHNEENLRKIISGRKEPLVEYLQRLQFISDDDLLPPCIPKDIYCQHYVATRIALRNLLGTVQQIFLAKGKQRHMSKKWSDYVSNLWHHERLRCLRNVAIPFIEETPIFEYDPATGLYGYQYGSDEEPDENEELFLQSDSSLDSTGTSAQLPNNLQDNDSYEGSSHSQMQQRDSDEGQQQPTNETHDNKKQLKDICTNISVTDYLTHIKLKEYAELFEEGEVDGKLLWEMCHAEQDELNDLGVTNAFHRRKIISKLEQYLTSNM